MSENEKKWMEANSELAVKAMSVLLEYESQQRFKDCDAELREWAAGNMASAIADLRKAYEARRDLLLGKA